MSEKLPNSAENAEVTRSTVPEEIIDFETRLAAQQEELAAAQAGVENLDFKSSAEDHVRAKGELRDVQAKYDDNMASLSDEWMRHGGERLESARMAVESLDFNSDASERSMAQAELRDAEDAWRDSYNAEHSTDQPSSPDVTSDEAIDAKAAEGKSRINEIADGHMQAIEDHAEQASAEIHEDAEQAEGELTGKFDLDKEVEAAKQRISDSADEKEAEAQERFAAKSKIDVEEVESSEQVVDVTDNAAEIAAAKQALEYQDRSDEDSDKVESDFESGDSSSSEFESEESEKSDDKSDISDEFVDDESSSDAETTGESSTEADDSEFIDDDAEESEEYKKRFGKIRSFISNMRKKAGIVSVKAYNTTMEGFGKIGKPMTSRLNGELDESYENRSKVRGLAMVALAATAYAAYNRFSGGDGLELPSFNTDGDNGGGTESILGSDSPDVAGEVDGPDLGDIDHDNTPDVSDAEWGETANTVEKGEGWYQTFEDMGIPKDEWDNLLQKVGPELKNEGYAYTMPDGSYGISNPGQLPDEVLNMIERNR